MKRNIFGKVISSYTDTEAVDDGILVEITDWRLKIRGISVGRITSNLLEKMLKFFPDENDTKELVDTFRHKIRMATFDGDMAKLPPNIWAVINERGNYTLMLPEDY